MTSNDDSRGGKTSTGSNITGKRPHATLELKAVKIKDRSGSQKTPGTPPRSGSASLGSDTSKDAPKQESKTEDPPAMSTPKSSSTESSSPSNTPETPKEIRGDHPPAQQIIKRRGGFFGPLVGGVVGAFLALFAGDYALQQLGVPKLAGSETQHIDAIEARLGDLEQQVAATDGGNDAEGSANAQTLDTITSELAQLKTLSKTTASLVAEQAKLNEQVNALAATEETDEDVVKRLRTLEERIAVVSAAAEANPDAGPIPQIAALTQKVSELETAVSDQAAKTTASGLTEEADSQLKTAVAASTTATSETQRLDAEFAAVKSTANRLDQRVESLKSQSDKLSESIKILNETTLKMSSDLSALRTTLQSELGTVARPADINAAVTPYKDRIANLETNLKELEKLEERRAQQAKSVVLSLELASLQRAVNAGKPFADDLAKVRAVAGNQPALNKLEPLANKGVPTLAALQETFRPLIHKMLQAGTSEPDASLFGRLMDQARSVVRVRKVNHESDDTSVEAVVARMEENLKSGKLVAVIDEANALPDENKAPAEGWLDDLAARTTIDNVMQTLQSELKSTLSKTSLTPAP